MIDTIPFQATPDELSAYKLVVNRAMRNRLRVVMVLGAVLYLVFTLLDHGVYPEQAMRLLPIRIFVGAFLLSALALDYRYKFRDGLPWLVDAAIIVPSAGVAVMLMLTDGGHSNYYHGISLILLAMFTINSFYVAHNVFTGIVALLLYVLGVLLSGVPFTAAHFASFAAFTCGVEIFVIVLTSLYGRQHFNEFLKSTALAQKVLELDQVNQRLIATERLKDRFFANVSHELRTPLTLILGPLRRFLTEWNLADHQRGELNVVEKNAKVLLKHVNDLLDLAKLDAGQVAMNVQQVDLAALVRFVASHFDVLANDKRITFKLNIADQLMLLADPEKLKRILFNLLGNAFKFTPSGGTITCQLSELGGLARLEIADTGPGIPESMHNIIFERFRQADDSDTRTHGGTGLGLAIAKEFAKLHEGDIEVRTAEPHGAILTVTLPIRFDENALVATAPEDNERSKIAQTAEIDLHLMHEVKEPVLVVTSRDKQAPTIVVIEDHAEMNRFIVSNLAERYQVVAAFNGEDGLSKIRDVVPDLIITDLMMPRMSGEQVLEIVRKDKKLMHIPVLVLTAKAEEQLRERLLCEGAQDFLSKPFSVLELLARVENLVATKKARDILEVELTTKKEDLDVMVSRLSAARRAAEVGQKIAEEESRMKDEFLMNLSHELRTPLTSIVGWADLLRSDNSVSKEVALALESIARNAHLQKRLIDDLLDMASIVHGKLQLDLSDVDLIDIVEDSIATVSMAAQKKEVKIVTHIIDDTIKFKGDGNRIQQVVLNLLTNAIKFSLPQSRIDITVVRTATAINVRIQDQGEGIDPEFLPHIFERLRQGDSSSSKKHAGLGLGLAIAAQIIELHGGKIFATSMGRGMGSTFEFFLPTKRATKAKYPRKLTSVDLHP